MKRISFSCYNNYSANICCLVITKITEKLSKISFDKNTLHLPPGLIFADPVFNETSDINILMGSHTFRQIVSPSQHFLGNSLPVFQNSHESLWEMKELTLTFA